jgi:HK97 family phage portal protein
MLGRMGQTLARLITPRARANPAGEGNWHPGPYTVNGGWLPSAWGQYLNFWQMDYDPLPIPSNSIVEACTWAYIRAIAQLPGYHKAELGNGGTETITTSALSRILRAPNPYQTPSDFLVHLIRSLLLAGNSYWIAQRNDRNEVTALHWTDPRGCRPRTVAVSGQAYQEVFYEISDNPLLNIETFGRYGVVVPARDVLHLKLATPRHPLIGETWLTALALEIASRAAMGQTAATFSQNMSRPSGVLQTDLTLTKAQVDELRERWNAQAAGMNAGGVPILTSGLKFEPISMSNEDAQVIEQLKLTDRSICAVFGVPPMLIGIADGTGVKSAEAQMSEWLASGLGWLINHIEVAFDQFFGLDVVPAGREWTEYDTRILLRANFKERMEGLARGVQSGVLAPNEGRALEGYKAAEDGDEPRMQQQMVPLSAWDKAPPAPPGLPAPAPPAGDNPDDQADPQAQRALKAFQLRQHLEAIQ